MPVKKNTSKTLTKNSSKDKKILDGGFIDLNTMSKLSVPLALLMAKEGLDKSLVVNKPKQKTSKTKKNINK